MSKRKIHGILLLDKAMGPSSNQILQSVKRLFTAEKAGHTGSLDPLASGMLPICFGEATKFSQYLLEADKVYETTMQLGVRTTTSDSEGDIVSKKPVPVLNPALIETALSHFRGAIQQVPSMYSALKYQGRPLYEYARAGVMIDRPARPIHIYALTCLSYSSDQMVLRVHCSKGTYIRTLVDDLGEYLGCGAHVIALRRLAVGQYQPEQMQSLSQLQSLSEAELEAQLIPMTSALYAMPAVQLTEQESHSIRQGQTLQAQNAWPKGLVQLLSLEQVFLGVGRVKEEGLLVAERMVAF